MRIFLMLLTLAVLFCGCSMEESRPKPVNAAADPWQETFKPGEYPKNEEKVEPSEVISKAPVQDTSGAPQNDELPPNRRLDIQANHENGTQIQISSIGFDDTKTALDVTVINGSGEDIQLNSFGKEMMLKDSLGNDYMVVPPLSNEALDIPAGETMKASLHFAGRIHPEADSVTLVTNDRTGQTDSRTSRRPKFRIEIPIRETLSHQS